MFIAQSSLREVEIYETSLRRHSFAHSLRVVEGLLLQFRFYYRSSYLNFILFMGMHVPTVSISSVSRLIQSVQENLRLKAHVCSQMLHTVPTAAVLNC